MSDLSGHTPKFEKAATKQKRLKLFLWGDSGAGKTTLALQFPHPVVIDLEGGTDHYGESFDFDVLRATDADEIVAAVDWLLRSEHSYRTLVIDPVTVFWDALQKKWSAIFLRRNKGSKGHRFEFYDLQPRDWKTIKDEFKEFISKLIQLDMNVIVTARQKVQYADSGFMRVDGVTFDGEKNLPYMFDSMLRLYRDEKGRFMAENIKDRSNKLPGGHFEISYTRLEQCLDRRVLAREAIRIAMATAEQVGILRQLIAEHGIDQEAEKRQLAKYGAECLEDLTEDYARLIISKLERAANKTVAKPERKENGHAEN